MKYKKNKFYFNIVLASFAMAGIFVLQTIWFINAYNLKNELFDYKVNVALKSIVNQMVDKKHEMNKEAFCEYFCVFQNQNVVEHIDEIFLDSIINAEFESLEIDRFFEYAVYKKKSALFVLGNYEKYKNELLNSKYAISLSCVSSCALPDDFFYLAVVFPEKELYIIKQLITSLIAGLFFFVLLILSYFKTISYYIKLSKLSAVKADFINNLTHEFKTPIATVSVAGEMLKKDIIINNKEKRDKYLDIIITENERLKKQVNQILQISLIEKKEVVFNFEEVNAHKIINECISNFEMILNQKGGRFDLKLNAEKSIIKVDKEHFYNIISNLIDNALKYNNSINPLISIQTVNDNNNLNILVSDNGIGISKEYISDIFKQFYRVPTGNIHNIKGFGLGLYYIKTVLKSMQGSIEIKSELSKGTTFKIVLPLMNI